MSSTGATLCRHALVSGHVQGVAYRWTTAARARELGLAGWVRNLPDGRVEAVIQGPPAAVQALLAWMERGPPAARVEQLVTREHVAAALSGFEILPTARTG